MKCLVFLSLLFLFEVSFASPIPTGKDGPLLEIKHDIAIDAPKHRWELVPDKDGNMHLVDLNP